MGTLRNKIVVVTGATSGIGRATAIGFSRKGAKVVLAGRRDAKLHEVETYIRSFNDNCMSVKTDVSREQEVTRLFEQTEKTFGTTDILVNCAGRGLKKDLPDITSDEWYSVIHTNLTGVFFCTKEAANRMMENQIKGHIITVSSIAGFFGAPRYSAYSASKHGVTGFQRSIKWELKKHGIRVSTIHPARVSTEFFNIYNKRPPEFQMLSSDDIARYIIAIASGSGPKRLILMAFNACKRLWNLTKVLSPSRGKETGSQS